MTPDEIRAAINADPALVALAEDGNTQAIADALSAGRTKIVSHFASERGVLERFPGGALAADALMTKLEGFAATAHPMASIVKRALKFLAQAEGLDIGSPATLGLIDALQAGGVITAEERNGLRAMATVADPITHTQVGEAIRGGL
jgi:hypothetical protein